MSTGEDMRSLTDEIIHSHQDRVATIAELRNTVKFNLKDVLADLAKGEAERKAAVGIQMNEMAASRAAMSQELKTELATSTANLKRDLAALLVKFGQAHNAMSAEMRADLARGRQIRAKGEKERQKKVSEFRNGMRRTLDQERAALQDQLKESRGKLAQETADWRASTQAQLAGAHDEWQKLTGTMPAKRGAVAVAVKTPKTAPLPPAEDKVALRQRVFEYLADHPNGTKMAELELQFGQARIQMVKIIKGLMDENKVEKRDFFYFAI